MTSFAWVSVEFLQRPMLLNRFFSVLGILRKLLSASCSRLIYLSKTRRCSEYPTLYELIILSDSSRNEVMVEAKVISSTSCTLSFNARFRSFEESLLFFVVREFKFLLRGFNFLLFLSLFPHPCQLRCHFQDPLM